MVGLDALCLFLAWHCAVVHISVAIKPNVSVKKDKHKNTNWANYQ